MPETTHDSLTTKALKRLHRLGWPARYAALITADLLAIVLAQLLAFALAHNTVRGEVLFDLLRQHQASLPLSMIGFVGFFFAFRLYRCAWRFASLGTLRGVIVATTCGVCLSVLLQWALDPVVQRPATLVIFWMLTIGLVGGMRILLRLAGISRSHGLPTFRQFRHDQAPKRVIILGSDAGAVRIHRALLEDPLRQYRVIGFLDDESQRHGMLIQDVLVLGPIALLAEYVRRAKSMRFSSPRPMCR